MRTGGRRDQVSPDLLLAEELLLLSLDDEKGSDQTWSSIDGGLAGALLLELTEAGALRLEDDKLVPGASVPADPLLVEALEVVRSSEKPRDAKHWVTKLPGQLKPLRRRLAERLVERGILAEDSKELLGLTVSRLKWSSARIVQSKGDPDNGNHEGSFCALGATRATSTLSRRARALRFLLVPRVRTGPSYPAPISRRPLAEGRSWLGPLSSVGLGSLATGSGRASTP